MVPVCYVMESACYVMEPACYVMVPACYVMVPVCYVMVQSVTLTDETRGAKSYVVRTLPLLFTRPCAVFSSICLCQWPRYISEDTIAKITYRKSLNRSGTGCYNSVSNFGGK
jgi:hypothetical protein